MSDKIELQQSIKTVFENFPSASPPFAQISYVEGSKGFTVECVPAIGVVHLTVLSPLLEVDEFYLIDLGLELAFDLAKEKLFASLEQW